MWQTKNRFANFGSGSAMAAGEQPRSSHGSSFAQGFGNGTATWNGGIWGNTAIGSGLKNASNDNARIQGAIPEIDC